MTTTFPTPGDGYVSGRDYTLDECCIGQWRRWRAAGTITQWVLLDPGPPTAYGFIVPTLAARWAFPDGSFTYLANGAFLFAAPGLGWEAQFFSVIASYDGIGPTPTTLATGGTNPVPPYLPLTVLPTQWQAEMWWDSLSPHDVVTTISVGSGGFGYGTTGARYTGAEPYLLGPSIAPLSEAESVGVLWGGSFGEIIPEDQVGAVTAWDLRCASDPGSWETQVYEPVEPLPCTPDGTGTSFFGAAGSLGALYPPFVTEW